MNRELVQENSARMGIAINTSNLFEHFTLVLDTNNDLWYADNEDKSNFLYHFEEFQLVLFEMGENHKAFDVRPLPSGYEKDKFQNSWKIEDRDSANIDFPIISNLYPECPYISYLMHGWYQSNDIYIIRFLLEQDLEKTLSTRYFIFDYFTQTTREFTKNEIILFNSWLEKREQPDFPIDGEEVQKICETVKNFNPYEVFESYSITIGHRRITNVGKDDDEYDCKCYSLKYFDKYLSKWFENYEYDLRIEDYRRYSGTPFAPVNFTKHSPKRFYDEEEQAKKKAYAEYSKMEHFDCLMKEYYDNVLKHIEDIKKENFKYTSFFWLPDYLNMDKVYYWLDNYLDFRYSFSGKKECEIYLLNDIGSFYNLKEKNFIFESSAIEEEKEEEEEQNDFLPF